ncbi:hypothetical protein ABID46_000680 [Moheibacter stercoris]|uniref:Uncharacterized protein n=1 Tax=Moheibacter stercoris TaxID=1628251 RepID=A0ABV2LRB1_9FLAO
MKNQFFEFIKVLIRKYDNTYVSRVFYQYQYEAVSFFENSSKLIPLRSRTINEVYRVELAIIVLLFVTNS